MNELDQALQLSEQMLTYAQQAVWEHVGRLEQQRRVLYLRARGNKDAMKVDKVKAIIGIDREIVRLRCRGLREGENGPTIRITVTPAKQSTCSS